MEIIPSILGNNPEEVADQTTKVAGRVPIVHLDVMDGRFVDQTSPLNLDQLLLDGQRYDIHLMVYHPSYLFYYLQNKLIRYVFISAEIPVEQIEVALQKGFQLNLKIGLAFKTDTELELLEKFNKRISAVLLMSVEPGASGRIFDPKVLPKLKIVSERFPQLWLEVDGGINEQTISKVSVADAVVVHSAIFNKPFDPLTGVIRLNDLLQ